MKYRFDYLNVIALLMLMFVVCLGAAFAQSQETEPTIPFYRPALEVTPAFPVEGGDVTFTVRGYLDDGSYAFIAPNEAQIVFDDENDVTRVFLPFKVIKASEVGIQVLIDVEEKITVTGLPEGQYEAIATINGVVSDQKKFRVAPEGTPEPIDYSQFNLQIAMDPVMPAPGDEVTFYIIGAFPSAGYTVVDQRLDIMESLPEQIAARIYVDEPTGPDAQVITPFRVIAGKAVLSEGVHPLIGTVNDVVFFEGAFDVGGKVQPRPEPMVPDVKIVIEPEYPEAGEEFTVFVEGVFPSPGYFIAEKSMYMTRSIPAHVVVNLTVLPLEGIAPHDPMPFKEEVGTVALPTGAHPLRGFMNDVLFYEARLIVGEDEKPEFPIYKFGIEMLPPNPRPGEAFDVYAVGIFPTPGYVFTRKDLSVGESEPETLIAALQIEAPVGGQPEVEEPFREWIGTQTLDEGKYPVHAIVNNIMMYRATLTVGGDESPPNSEWITFQRSGGFTGWVQNLTVDMDRSALITSDSVIEANNRSGLVPQESFDRLSEIMETIDFSVLDSYYPKEVPIADGYVYEITVNRDQALLVEQGAMAPPEVADLVSVLERILDGRIDLDRRLDSESSVSNWSMY